MDKVVYKKMFEREDEFWWHQGMRKITSSMLLNCLPRTRGLKILDAGCGTGGMFQMLQPFGQIDAIDKSVEAVVLAKKRGIANVQVADIHHLPFQEGSFDLVLCSDVLYHKNINNDEQVLRELHRVLAPGGYILVREAAYNWLRSEHDRFVWTKHRFTKPELISKLQHAKFTVVRASYINFFLFPLALMLRLSEKIRKSSNSQQSFFIVNPILNNFLKSFLWLEAKMIGTITFPFGLSIICFSRKNNAGIFGNRNTKVQ